MNHGHMDKVCGPIEGYIATSDMKTTGNTELIVSTHNAAELSGSYGMLKPFKWSPQTMDTGGPTSTGDCIYGGSC